MNFRIDVFGKAARGRAAIFFIILIMKAASKIILATYILAEIMLLLYSGVYFLVLKGISDYEMFAFNFYGSLLLFGSSCLMALLLRFIFKITNKIILGVLLFILPNIVGWFYDRRLTVYVGF